MLGVVEGVLILVAILLILDPYYSQLDVQRAVGIGEFTALRTLHDLFDGSLTGGILRDNIVPFFLAILGFLFPQDIRDAFASGLVARI